MATHAHSTPSSVPAAFDYIDLDTHPDGALMRLCSQAARLRDRAYLDGIDIYQCPGPEYLPCLHRLINQVSDTAPRTQEGFRLKALFLLGDDDDPRNTWAVRAPLVSVVKDALRLGLHS